MQYNEIRNIIMKSNNERICCDSATVIFQFQIEGELSVIAVITISFAKLMSENTLL